jgi:hypothetical protein
MDIVAAGFLNSKGPLRRLLRKLQTGFLCREQNAVPPEVQIALANGITDFPFQIRSVGGKHGNAKADYQYNRNTDPQVCLKISHFFWLLPFCCVFTYIIVFTPCSYVKPSLCSNANFVNLAKNGISFFVNNADRLPKQEK